MRGILHRFAVLLALIGLPLAAAMALEEFPAPKPPVIDIFLDRPTEILINQNGDLYAIAAVDKLKKYMDRTGLEYRLRFVPWSRAMRLVEQSDHALLFQVLRTPEREKRFHWLLPVFESEALYLIALDTTPEARLSLDGVLTGKTLIGCQKTTAHCTVLSNLGIARDRIKEIPVAIPTAIEQMLLRERVDMIVAYMSVARKNLEMLGENPDRAIGIAPIDKSDDYLAAPLSIDPEILRILMSTPHADLPPLKTP